MIRRLRAAAPSIIVSGAAALVSLTALAQAAKVEYATIGEMHRFVVTSFLGGAGTLLGALAIIYNMVDKARTSELRTIINANGEQVRANAAHIAEILEMFKAHHLDEDAHPAGSRARIDPIKLTLAEMREKQDEIHLNLTALIAEHHYIRKTEDTLCRVLSRRDPSLSPNPRRDDDPHDFDGRPLRGKP